MTEVSSSLILSHVDDAPCGQKNSCRFCKRCMVFLGQLSGNLYVACRFCAFSSIVTWHVTSTYTQTKTPSYTRPYASQRNTYFRKPNHRPSSPKIQTNTRHTGTGKPKTVSLFWRLLALDSSKRPQSLVGAMCRCNPHPLERLIHHSHRVVAQQGFPACLTCSTADPAGRSMRATTSWHGASSVRTAIASRYTPACPVCPISLSIPLVMHCNPDQQTRDPSP